MGWVHRKKQTKEHLIKQRLLSLSPFKIALLEELMDVQIRGQGTTTTNKAIYEVKYKLHLERVTRQYAKQVTDELEQCGLIIKFRDRKPNDIYLAPGILEPLKAFLHAYKELAHAAHLTTEEQAVQNRIVRRQLNHEFAGKPPTYLPKLENKASIETP